MSDTPCTVEQRITDYLAGGGLFNAELANHDAVRDLLIDARSALSKERSDKERFARELLMHTTGKSYVENGSKTHARWCMLCDTESPPDAERLTHKPGCLIAEAEEALASAPCEQCGGSGLVTLKGVPNGIGFEMDADDQPCPECK